MYACKRQLQDDGFTPRALMMRSRVEVICTTDSPLDSLHYHQLLKQDASFTPKVLPTFRPDEFFSHDRHQFSSALVRLAELTGETITGSRILSVRWKRGCSFSTKSVAVFPITGWAI